MQNSPKVTLTFDDGYESTYSIAYPILREKGFKATVFIVTDLIGKIWNGKRLMNTEQIRDLHRNGWEIGSHTKSHPHLSTLSDAILEAELRDSKKYLERVASDLKVTSLSYPFSDISPRVLRYAHKYYLLGRVNSLYPPLKLNDIPPKNMLMLKAMGGCIPYHTLPFRLVKEYIRRYVSIRQLFLCAYGVSTRRNLFERTKPPSFNLWKKWIDSSIRKKKWLILTFHDLGRNEIGEFSKLLDYIENKKISVLTLREILSSVA